MTTPFLPDELGARHRLAQHYPVLRAFFDIREMLRETEDIVCDAEEQVFPGAVRGKLPPSEELGGNG